MTRMEGFTMPLEQVAFRLLVALVLSAIIGLEREVHGKPAGLRTHALVGLGAAIMTICGVLIAEQYRSGTATTTVDPTRLASVVIQGIGFIGAGVIIQSRGIVKGLTSAATLWFVAAIGIAAGFGFWEISAISTSIALILLILFMKLEQEAERLELIHLHSEPEEKKLPKRSKTKRSRSPSSQSV
ncbi:MgtC/SapB family protein [Candidatus Uhrbacteria bacterium]|nr:MgtC/SapB family protein [Candidatus Uhrbacteria bacterium]